MYRVAIVDDQAEDAEALAQTLRRCHPAAVQAEPVWDISCFPAADALAAQLARGYKPDLAFVDIVLNPVAPARDEAPRADASPDTVIGADALSTPAVPQPAGIDAVARLFAPGTQTQIIYVSGYDAFHTQVYRTPHAAYLAKPFTAADVACAVDLALAARQRTAEAPLALRVRGTECVIRPAEILYLESNLHLVRIHTATKTVEAYTKLGDLLQQLPARFVRTHQSFAVNLDAVSALDAASITLTTGETIPVSRRMRAAVRDALFAHIRGMHR